MSYALKLYFNDLVIYDVTMTLRNQHQDEIKLEILMNESFIPGTIDRRICLVV